MPNPPSDLSLHSLEKKVNKTISSTGCWVWFGSRDSRGYGRIRCHYEYVKVHRLFYEHYKGPLGDKDCLHTCNNPSCVNPAHLYAGNDTDNARDLRLSGFRPLDQKLTEEEVKDIKAAVGYKTARLAEYFKVSTTTIFHIRNGNKWKHVNLSEKDVLDRQKRLRQVL